VPDAVRPAADLSEFAVATRYPGLGEPVTREDYANAVQVAEETVRWAESIVAERPDR
jgi:hypothetical protein